ncbi:hypothetical protein [Lelliottia nimipressuralis]
MKPYLIHTDNYWCAFDLGDPKGDKSVGIISRVDEKTGITAVLSTLDEHGIGLVVELANKLEVAENRAVELPTFDGYVPHVARELQAAFRIACDKAGIRIAATGRGI